MSLCYEGFNRKVFAEVITIEVLPTHPLVRLANKLPWQEMLDTILPDLQQTEKSR